MVKPQDFIHLFNIAILFGVAMLFAFAWGMGLRRRLQLLRLENLKLLASYKYARDEWGKSEIALRVAAEWLAENPMSDGISVQEYERLAREEPLIRRGAEIKRLVHRSIAAAAEKCGASQ